MPTASLPRMASQPQQGAGGAAQDPNPIGTWCVAPREPAVTPAAADARSPVPTASPRPRYNDVSHRTPVVARYVILALLSTYIISWFLPSLPLALTNCPLSTVGGFEIYRLFLSPFIGTQLLSVIFGSLMIYQSGGRLERAKGARLRGQAPLRLPQPRPHTATAPSRRIRQDPRRPHGHHRAGGPHLRRIHLRRPRSRRQPAHGRRLLPGLLGAPPTGANARPLCT